ncbi:MAG: hypothetical protein ACQKBV_09240, partial [Puniceicoccales bacterium]
KEAEKSESAPPRPAPPQPAIRPAAKETPRPSTYPRTQPKPASEEFRKRYLKEDDQRSEDENRRSKDRRQKSEVGGQTEKPPAPQPKTENREPKTENQKPQSNRWRLIGRLKVDYALFETEAGLTILRLRAAHERVWFERIAGYFASQSPARQQLLFPIPLEFEPRAAAALQEHLEWVQGNGFSLEEFGRNFYRLEAHPDWLPEQQAEPFVRDLVDRLREGEIDPRKTDLAHEQLAKIAATRSVRYDDDLPDAAIELLAEQLLACQQPLACPRGRPTIVEFTANELRKRFGFG